MMTLPATCESLNVRLRLATPEDEERVFQWRNTPEIVVLGRTQKTVCWEDHQTWFRHTIDDPRRLLLIVLLNDQPIGQVRFDQNHDEDHACEISIYLLAGFTGRGLGTSALKQSCSIAFDRLGVHRIDAVILKENLRSLSAFRKAGFENTPLTLDAVPDCFEVSLHRRSEASSRIRPEKDKIPEASRECSTALASDCSGIERVPHNRITHGPAEAQAVLGVLRTGYWASGPQVASLEAKLAEIAEVDHAVCVSSGLSALRLALKAFGVEPGEKVLVPAYSCVALANATLACGAEPVPMDVMASRWNVGSTEIEKQAVHERVKAAIVVHTFGLPAQIGAAQQRRIPVIEDCAHAFGMTDSGKPLGGHGDISVLSFYATKLIAAGEGGAVLTRSATLAEFVREWRDYGDQPPEGTRLNDKMTDLEAALALCQLDRLGEMLSARKRLAERYHQALSGTARETGAFRLPAIGLNRVWYRYVIEMCCAPAVEFIQKLRRVGISAEQPVWNWRSKQSVDCPMADHAYRVVLSLPLYPTLTLEEQDRVIHSLKEVCQEHAQSGSCG